ncbi:carbonic anhydrase family protein [Lautropia mirabilis]
MHIKQLLVPLLLSGLFLSSAAMAETAQPAADAAGASPGQVPAASSDSKPAEKPAHWSYGGNEGPAYWGELSTDYSQCSIGRNQSPVDLNQDDAIRSNKDSVQVDYQPMGYELVNNGHTLRATPQGTQPPLQIGSRTFTLKQFHFHDPSEHTFKGRHFPLELHRCIAPKMVRWPCWPWCSRKGMRTRHWRRWSPSRCPRGQTRKLTEPLDIRPLLPKKLSYFRLNGSLTTPPCSEGVTWVVFSSPVTASKAQIEALSRLMGGPNNRPVQPLNARILVDDDR